MATYYWVGGSGTWNGSNTANWAATSGGAGNAGVPIATDLVFFDSNSGTAATVTVESTAVSSSTTVNKSDLTISLNGNVTLCSTTGTFTLTSGTLNFNNYRLTTGRFVSSTTSARTMAFGSTGEIYLNTTGSAGSTSFNVGTQTNCTITGIPRVIYIGSNTGYLIPQSTATPETAFNYTIYSLMIITNDGVVGDITITGQHYIDANLTCYGNYSVGITTYAVNTKAWTFAATSSKTISTPYTFLAITFNGVGGSWTMQNALNVTNTFTLTNGTFNSNGYSITAKAFDLSNSNVRALNMGASSFTVNAASGTGTFGWLLDTSTNMTLTPGTSQIRFINSLSGTAFNGGGLTYNNFSGFFGSGSSTNITGSNTFNSLILAKSNTLGTNFTVAFEAGSTTTVSSFEVQNPAPYVATIVSSSAGSTATLSKATGVVSVDYVNLKDSVATGGATWYAGNNSIDSGNNTGWVFSAPPSAAFFLFF